jgi:hypothetical protein
MTPIKTDFLVLSIIGKNPMKTEARNKINPYVPVKRNVKTQSSIMMKTDISL